MALGRFAGGFIIQRFGRAPVLRVAGTLASTGVAALCLVPSTLTALIGALAWGLGYGGFLFGAPLIGFLAHMMPLDRALLAVAALVLLVAILAPVAREHGRELVKA